MFAKRISLRRGVLASLLVALAIHAQPAWAQTDGILQGQVLAPDGTTVAGAQVALTRALGGDARETTSDSTGRFSFREVRADEYVVTVSKEGFARRDIRVPVAPREVRTLVVSLEVGRLDVNVVVSGETHVISGTHSPSSTVLTEARLDALPAAERTNLPDAIVTLAPGMIRGHDDFVHIRGHEIALNPSIDGVSFWENPHAVFSGGLSPDVIETANVMTGGFPAEYGNRFGGVLDIVTKSGSTMENDGALTVNAGEAGRRSASGEFGGHRGSLAYFGFGSIVESDRFLSPPDREAIHDSGRGGHAFLHVERSLGAAGTVDVVAMGDASNFEIPITRLDTELRPGAGGDQRTRQQSAIARWTRAATGGAIAVSGYQRWSRLRLEPASDPLAASASLQRELLTVGGKADMTRFAGRHVFKAGVDAVFLRPDEQLRYDYSGYRTFAHLVALPHIHLSSVIDFTQRTSGGQVSAYAQDSIELGDRVTADLGVRIDRHDLVVQATHASPRVNLAYRLGSSVVVHTSYNHFFVPPAIEGVLSSSAGLTRYLREIGTALPALEPTIEDQFEAGASAPLGPLALALTGYFRATDNPVHTTIWPDSRIYSYASFDRARAYGLEAKADVRGLSRFGVTGYVNYALGRVNFYNPVTGGFVTEAEHLTEHNRFLAPMDQTHTLTTGLSYRHAPSGFIGGTTIEYGSGTPIGHGAAHEHAAGEADHADPEGGDAAARVPGHVTGNLFAGVELLRRANRGPRLTLRVDVENVSNDAYVIAREGEFSAAQYAIPRLISATVRVRF